MTHEVRVLCSCDNIERCSTELYVSDVRIAQTEINVLRNALHMIAAILRQQATSLRLLSNT